MKRIVVGKDASHLHTAFNFSEYFNTLILPHKTVQELKIHVLQAVFGPHIVIKHFKLISNMCGKVSFIQTISIECLQAEVIIE